LQLQTLATLQKFKGQGSSPQGRLLVFAAVAAAFTGRDNRPGLSIEVLGARMSSIPVLADVADVDVVLTGRRVLGEHAGELEVAGQVSIGRSDASLLRPGGVGIDDDLGRMLARDKGRYLYHVAMLSCTFRTNSERVVAARLSVALLGEDGARVPDAVVWSMDPLRASTPITAKLELNIGVNGKFGVKRTQDIPTDLVYLLAEGEGENPAEWLFAETRAVSLAGVHRLGVVTRTPADRACRIDLALAATRREKRLGLVPYRARIPSRVRTIELPRR
jgi:hypothetical protein